VLRGALEARRRRGEHTLTWIAPNGSPRAWASVDSRYC